MEPDLPFRRREPVWSYPAVPVGRQETIRRRGDPMAPPPSRDMTTVTEIVEPPKPAGMAALLPLALGALALFARGT